MDEQTNWVLVGLVAAVVGAIVFKQRLEKKRSAALGEAAARLGLSFRERDAEIRRESFTRLPLFEKGRRRRFRNVGRGPDLLVFGYEYTTGRRRRTRRHRQTVVARRLEGAALPAFQLTPERLFDRIGVAFGGQDIDFEADPAFSSAYRLRSGDEAAARELLRVELRHELTLEKDWCLEGQGEWLVLYQRKRRVSPDALDGFIERARRLSEMIAASAEGSRASTF